MDFSKINHYITLRYFHFHQDKDGDRYFRHSCPYKIIMYTHIYLVVNVLSGRHGIAEPLLCVAHGHDFGEQLVGLDKQPGAENERKQVCLVRIIVSCGHQVLDQAGQRTGQKDAISVD